MLTFAILFRTFLNILKDLDIPLFIQRNQGHIAATLKRFLIKIGFSQDSSVSRFIKYFKHDLPVD